MRTYEIRQSPDLEMHRRQRCATEEDDLRRELIERIQHVRKLEDGLMERQDYYDKTRIQMERRLLETPLDEADYERPSQRRWGYNIPGDDRLLVQTEPESLADFSGFEDPDNHTKNGEIVAMWAETGLLLNRIIADKDLEIADLKQQAEISNSTAKSRVEELEALATSAIEDKKMTLRELQDCKNTIKDLKASIRDLQANDSQRSRDAVRYREAESKITELQALLKEAQNQTNSSVGFSSSDKIVITDLRSELQTTFNKLRDAEAKIFDLETQLREAERSRSLSAIVAGTDHSLSLRAQEAENRCMNAEARIIELEAAIRSLEGRVRIAEQENSLHKAHASVLEERAKSAEHKNQDLQLALLQLESQISKLQLENDSLMKKLDSERNSCEEIHQRLRLAEESCRASEAKFRDFENKTSEELRRAQESKVRELEMERLKLTERALMSGALMASQKLMKPILLQFTFSLRLKEVPNMKDFESEVIHDISRAADVYPSAIDVVSVRAGSSIATISLASNAVDSQGRKGQEIAENILMQSKDTSSKLYQGKHTCRTLCVNIKKESEAKEHFWEEIGLAMTALFTDLDSVGMLLREAHARFIKNKAEQQNEIRSVKAQMQDIVLAHAFEKRQALSPAVAADTLPNNELRLQTLLSELNECKAAQLKKEKVFRNMKQEYDNLREQLKMKDSELKEYERRIVGFEKLRKEHEQNGGVEGIADASPSRSRKVDTDNKVDSKSSELPLNNGDARKADACGQEIASPMKSSLQSLMHYSMEAIIDCFRDDSSNKSTKLTGGCLSLLNLTSRGGLYLKQFKLTKWVHIIFRALRSQEPTADLIVCALSVLSAISADKDVLAHILGEGNGIQAVTQIARTSHDLVVQEQSCWTLQALAEKSEDARKSIIKHGGIEILVSVLHRNKSDCDICITAFLALTAMSEDGDEFCQELAEKCGAEAVIDSMRMNRRSQRLQEHGYILIASLVGLSQGREPIRAKIGDAGGLDIAVVALKESSNTHIKEKACAAIKCLAANGNVSNVCKLAELGAIESILSTMTDHLKSEYLLLECCWALRNLAHNNELNKARIAMLNGSEKLIDVMKEHVDSASIQEQACWVLLYVSATNSANAEKIGLCGGVEVIIAAMKRHDTVEGVQGQGCWALANLASNSEANSKRLLECGGIEIIIAAMKDHAASLGVQAKACRALCRAARHYDPSCKRIRELGGVDAVMAAMRVHKTSSTVQHEGTDFLKTMANEFLKTMGLSSPGANASTPPTTPSESKKKPAGQSPRTPSSVTSPWPEGAKEAKNSFTTPRSEGGKEAKASSTTPRPEGPKEVKRKLSTPTSAQAPSAGKLPVTLLSTEQMDPVTLPSPRWATGRLPLTPDRAQAPVEPKKEAI